MKILVTGALGFIGKNLVLRLSELSEISVESFTSQDSLESLDQSLKDVDVVIHLAGVNRPESDAEFDTVNNGLTANLCNTLKELNRKPHIIFASSIQVERDNPYGKSKLAAENELVKYVADTGGSVSVFRLPNVFGKWCKPGYNSVVATFCHNIAKGEDVNIHDPTTTIKLVYIDDVVDTFIDRIRLSTSMIANYEFVEVNPVYSTDLGELARSIYSFRSSRETLITDKVGSGFTRALYATYLSYLKPESFSYCLESQQDNRGIFVEFLKTADSGQISFFTARPGITRGGHYHHTKNEKFLVVQGEAKFHFKSLSTKQVFELSVTASNPEVVETIPGWVHDISNTGDQDLIVLLWANEIFDVDKPDTIAAALDE
jgi:UDP-2-acetamido-2,6-beta-L-arabino-hexul-4-ose reductase